MRVNGLRASNIMFGGDVYINYQKMTKQIAQCPYDTQESIIGNVNTLKHRLESQDGNYILNFEYNNTRESEFLPTYHSAVISIKNEKGNSISNKFELGKTGGSRKDDRTELASGEDIWQKGFKEITQRAIDGSFEPDTDYSNLEKACKDRNWDFDTYAPLIIEIADKIENRAKVILNKFEIAASVYSVTKQCPDEIRESIIGNINTLTARLEKESAKEKAYILSVDNIKSSNAVYRTYNDTHLNIKVQANNSTHYDEYQEVVLPIGSYKDYTNYYCVTDSQQIYQKTFKPLTEKLLWDSHRYLPFKDDYEKKQIIDKLA